MKPLIHQFDLHGIGVDKELPDWIKPIMTAATLVGQPVVVAGTLVATSVYFWRAGQSTPAKATAVAVALLPLSSLIKVTLHRARPDTYVAGLIHSYSFPSGHAYATMLGYGLLGVLASKHLSAPWSFVVPFLLGLLILVVGISRVYLGAHYPSDVLGGWLLGIFVLIIVSVIFKL
jgi:undecaprenyl-diphosphatase